MKTFIKYFFIGLLFLALGYTWAAKAYLPHINKLEKRVTELEKYCSQFNKQSYNRDMKILNLIKGQQEFLLNQFNRTICLLSQQVSDPRRELAWLDPRRELSTSKHTAPV